MYQAITTKFLGPTNYRGSRIKANCVAGAITEQRNYEIDYTADHIAVAKQLATQLGWAGNWYGGCHSADGFVFVNVPIKQQAQADAASFFVAETQP